MPTFAEVKKYCPEFEISKIFNRSYAYRLLPPDKDFEDGLRQEVPWQVAEALTQARKERDELTECLALLGWKRTEQGKLEKLSQENKSPF